MSDKHATKYLGRYPPVNIVEIIPEELEDPEYVDQLSDPASLKKQKL